MKRILLILSMFLCIVAVKAQSGACYPGGDKSGPQGSGGIEQTPVTPSVGASASIEVLASSDPNEIVGPQGADDSLRWMSTEQTLGYTIYFENDPELATAHALRVEIRSKLDEKADPYTLGLGNFGFGSFIFPVDDAPAIYQKRLDVRDSLGIYVDVVAGIDVKNREVFWVFNSVDPVTGLPPTEADRGFLPINDREKHNGEGFVTFVMKANSDCVTGDSIRADASIVFDTNEAMNTNVWKNRLDAKAPTSSLKGTVDTERPSFYQLRFESQDDLNGSGVKQITLFLSRNKEPYQEYAVCSPDTLLSFEVESGIEYAFMTQAEDSATNKENLKEKADFTIQSNVAPTNLFLSDSTFQDDIAVDGFIAQLTTEDAGEASSFTYALAEGEGAVHNDLFRIEKDQLLAGTTFRCAKDSIYTIRLQTIDLGGLSFSKSFTLKMKHVLTDPEPKTIDVDICEGESYEFFGQSYNQAGTYTYAKENPYMCDSVYILNLRVNPYPEKPIITVNGSQLSSSALKGNQWFDEEGAIEGAVEQTFTPTVSGNYYVVVSNGVCESEPSDTYYVNLSGEQQVTWNLQSGWNWISVNMKEMTDPKKFLKPVMSHTERMVGQTQELTQDPVYGLVGELQTLSPVTSYKLKMSGNGTLTQGGSVYTASEVAIVLHKGWNWLGYVPAVELTPDVAFASLQPIRGDEVKGQTAFATYDGSHWVGSLQMMKPGEGYLYYSNQEKTFHYSTTQATALRSSSVNSLMESHAWICDPYRYPDNMSIIAAVYDEQTKVEPGIYAVGAFVGDECRGVGVYAEGYLFITVHGGKKGENISFKALENATGKSLSITETVRFGEATIGSLTQPFALHVRNSSSVGIEEIGKIFLSVYPNPVRSQLYIGGDSHLVKQVIVLSLNGQPLVQKRLNGDTSLDLSDLSDGAYVVVLETEKGFVYKKILKSARGN